MFPGGASKRNAVNTSAQLNKNNNKSETEHSSAPKKGFLLNFFDDDFSPTDSSQKSKSNLDKLKSLFDIDSKNTVDEKSNSKSVTSSDLGSSKNTNKTKTKNNHDNSLSFNFLPKNQFNEVNKALQDFDISTPNYPINQGFSISNPEPLKYDQNNTFFSSKDQTNKPIEDLKEQMKIQQQQIQLLLQQQQQQLPPLPPPPPPPPPNFQYPMVYSTNLNPTNSNNNLLNDKNIQNNQTEKEIPTNSLNLKLDTPKSSSKIPSFDFAKGDAPSFSVKFNFGTGKQFTSKTKPTKEFLKCNFNNFSFSKSKSDNINKKGGFDYTDSFLFKMPRENNKNNQNEKNILQIQDIKLYLLSSNGQNKRFFSTVGKGRISITENNNIYRIIVRNNKGNCILNTRIFPNIIPKINNNFVQIVGQNSDYNNEDYGDAENDDNKDSDDDAGKENILSIYRIKFTSLEKAKEFYQCITLIKK